MAHVKAGSSSAHQKANVAGKHRGLKVNQGQFVRGGQILVRQTGVVYKSGMNTKLSRDNSVVSRVAGLVQFSYMRRPNGVRTVINIVPQAAKVEKKVVTKKVVKAEAKVEKVVAEKKVATKKVVAKKTVAKKAVK